MGRTRKPARLWYGESEWHILDGGVKIRLGLGKDRRVEAEDRLSQRIEARKVDNKPAKARRASAVSCAEVLARYLEKSAVARPAELAARVDALLDYWGEMMLDAVDEDSCAAFAASLSSTSYARRCLEDMRAATRAYAKAGYLRDEVIFSLPKKSESREDWLTYEEARALVRTAWRYREVQRGQVTKRWMHRHCAKFIVVAIATCSRSARIYEAGYVAQVDKPWVDLHRGLYYRAAPGVVRYGNKRAPTIGISPRLLASMRRWHAAGDQYVVYWAGRAADPRKAFVSNLARARVLYPTLFLRPDGTPKKIVRHSLRHTGITWLALAGVDPYEICKYAGISMQIFEDVYSHFHPSSSAGVFRAQSKAKPISADVAPRLLLLPPPEAFEDAAE